MLVVLRRSIIGLCCLLVLSAASAQDVIIPAPPQLAASGYLLIDATTGEVLVEENADVQLPPASLTKMMTSYIVSGEVERGNLSESTMVNISVNAWQMEGSKMFIREGTQVSVGDLMRGVIVQSGNDASVALAEHVAGSESAFADIMNQQAALLGMTSTHYENATGWPADGHVTTARDLSLLARALINDHPQHYAMYAEESFEYNNINQPNRNRLLARDPSVDGIKTGHTEEAGYCLVSSAKKNGMRLIAVVMGTRSDNARMVESQKLLTYGFRYYQTHQLYSVNDNVSTIKIWAGKSDELNLGVTENVNLTLPRGAQEKLQAQMHIDTVIKAPIKLGQEIGKITVKLDDKQILELPLVAKQEIAQAGFFTRVWVSIKLFFMNLFGLL